MQGTATESEIKKFRIFKDDVIITKDSETKDDIAVSTLVLEDLPNVICGYHLALIRPNKNILIGPYLNKIFRLHRISYYFSTLANGVTRFGLTLQAIHGSVVPIPPIEEQKKIADILSAWDRAIDTIGKLIDAKQRLKKGLMQQLLTGRIRLPQFGHPASKKSELPNMWKEVTLTECFYERRECIPELPLLAITSDRGVILRNDLDRKDTSTKDKSKYKRIVHGDIGYNTMRMWQGVSAMSELEGIVSPAYTICTPFKGHYSKFYAYLFKYSPIINMFKRYSQGLVDDTLNLKFHNFARIKVTVPEKIAEQRRIAAVLETCDREIELLRKKETALKHQKKGLMQKLLTGEVRVKYK